MKAIYIEAFAGISGNMLLGALIDAGVPFDHLASEMKKLHLGEYELINERVNKCGIDANYFNVLLPDEHQHDVTIGHRHEHPHAGHHHHEHGDTGHNHEHHSDCAQHCHQVKVAEEPVHHHHEHRNLHDIAHIITHSDLHDKIKMQSLQVFTALAEAEAKVHGKTVDEVHFHEVGAIDTIIDIAGLRFGFGIFGDRKDFCFQYPYRQWLCKLCTRTDASAGSATAELLQGLQAQPRKDRKRAYYTDWCCTDEGFSSQYK